MVPGGIAVSAGVLGRRNHPDKCAPKADGCLTAGNRDKEARMTQLASERWEQIANSGEFDLLDDLLTDDVVFESPIVHTPQLGRAITRAYLIAAVQVLKSPQSRFVNRWFGERSAVLELETEIDGVKINAVDIISWNLEGRINRFKVMVRPLKAINALHQAMGRQLATSGATSSV
jgi:hypothetical protein